MLVQARDVVHRQREADGLLARRRGRKELRLRPVGKGQADLLRFQVEERPAQHDLRGAAAAVDGRISGRPVVGAVLGDLTLCSYIL